VTTENKVIAEARNRSNQINVLAHPEIELARWALDNLTVDERKNITMYTSGEHCPMCAAAHGWAGLGTIVYLSSAKQLEEWRRETGATKSPVNFLAVHEIVPSVIIKGPATGELLEEIKSLQIAYYKKGV